jgi:hypothetical protein
MTIGSSSWFDIGRCSDVQELPPASAAASRGTREVARMRARFEFNREASSDPSLAAPSADERFPAARFRIPCKFPVRAEQEIAFNRLIALGFSARNCGSEGLFRSFSLQIPV